MLKHIVMWKLKEQAGGRTKAENALWMKEHLEALVGVVPQLRSAHVGINVVASDGNYDAVLESTFDNEADLNAYKVHPAHVAVSDYCKSVRESRVAIDYVE